MKIKLTNVAFYFRKKLLTTIMRAFVFLLCATAFSLTPDNVMAQNAKIVINSDGGLSVNDVFKLIKAQTDYLFIYQESLFDDFPKIKVEKGTIKANELLERSLSAGDFDIELAANNTIVITVKEVVQQTITGHVTDENGMAIAGVNVLENGTNNGAVTGFDGNYSIVSSKGKSLTFSFIGMLSSEVLIEDDLRIDIVLKIDSESLEEVVLIGYGSQKRKDLTGSVSKIDVKEINKFNPISIDNAIIGRAAGVYGVTASGAPGASAAIRIRGITSVFGNNEPLYVIDGLPIEVGQGQGNNFYASNFSSSISPLASINPQDVESIDILKDASATAIYGSRGANGVIIITTKKGSYSSVPSISLSATTSSSNFTNEYSMLNSKQFHDVIETAYNNAGSNLPNDDQLYPYGPSVDTDWGEEIDQAAINTNYYLNANGGSLNGSSLYSLSAGVTDQKGAIYNTAFKRNNLRTKLETKLSDKLRVGVNFNYSDSKNKGSNTTFYYQTIKYRPDVPVFDEDGDYGHDTGNAQANPYAKVRYPAYVENRNLILSLFGEYEITKGLLFKSTYSYNTSYNKSFRYTPSHDPSEIRNNRKGTLNQTDSEFSSRILDNTLTFSKSFNKHDINSVAGVSYTQNKSEFSTIRATDFPDDDVMVTPGAASSLNLTSGGTVSVYRLIF